MIDIKNKVDCCGCNACGDVCTHKAITFKKDNEGFLYPIVDESKCTNCGLCERVCPIINIELLKQKSDKKDPECFAAQHKNLQALFNSTSGCAFVALADKMYKEGGYVGGAIFNDDYSVSQFISSNKDDLEKLRNSKYVQSDSQGFYIAVRDLLNAGEKVLVCGLPCQMAGLRTFLRKDYDNLIIVDLICLGINSPKILPAYLKYLEEKHQSKIVYYKAKNKELGWRQLTTKVVFENGDVEYDKRDTNYFTVGFISTHAFARPSCYECKFKGFPRFADITIGDFWGAEKYIDKEIDNDLGTSIILTNTSKGLDYYQKVKNTFKEKQVPLNIVIKGNHALIKSLSGSNFDRKQFYEDFDKMSFINFAKKYIKRPIDGAPPIKRKIKNWLIFGFSTLKASSFSPITLWKNIYYNFICRQFRTNIALGEFITIHKHTIINIGSNANVIVNGRFSFGAKRVKGSKLESRLLIEDGATLYLNNGVIMYGADIEIFKNAILSLGDGIIFNINATIICGDKITIDNDVCFGRNVTVRDNNGNHFISRRIYKEKRPVSIGQHSWLTEHVIVMPGAKIGTGVIISAGSMVVGKLPNFTLATGIPAKVVDEEVYWKC
jgi:acetyltransferase-like isoleucine patch superfamily enzyme/coenzyme F420-reducing hydrogenase beta subunit